MITRRKLVTATAGGTLFGLTGVMLTRGEASIRFIGRRSTIIALLDTKTERVLFLLGEQDDGLLSHIPGLTTVGNSRIDLVIASHRILATAAARKHLQTETIPTLAIQASNSLPPIRGEVTSVTSSLMLNLGETTSMQIDVGRAKDDHPDFLVAISSHGCSLLMGSSHTALRMANHGHCDLLTLPGSAASIVDSNISPQLLVCNSLSDETGFAQMDVFPTDPISVQIGNGAISIRDDQLSF